MSVKETFEWKSIVVICIALLITLLAVTTANAAITLGDQSGNGINTTNGTNIVEHNGLSTFLNFSAIDDGNITFLNLTFPAQISLPYNTSANYTLVGLNSTWENITITNNVLSVFNGAYILAFANSEFSINITNITWSSVPNGTYAFLLNTSNTTANSQINLTIDGEPTVTPITFNQSVNTWVTNDTVLNFNASISDLSSGVKNATIDISSLNSSAGIINLDIMSGYWINISNIVGTSQEGRHNITIVSYDNASQVNNTVNFSVWVDNTGPIVVASNYTEVPTWVNNNTLLMLNASIVDSGSGPYNATVNALFINSSLTNAVILEHAGTIYWTNYTAAIVNIATQGRINLTITAYDNVSLYNSSVNFSVWVDSLTPIVTPITYYGAQTWVNNGTVLDLNMSITEQGVLGVTASGVDSSQSYINISAINSTQTAILANTANYWINDTIIVNTSNTGQVNLTIWAYDNATNVNSSVNFTMWVDNVKPDVTNLSTTYPGSQTAAIITDTVTLNVTVTDSGGSGLNVSSIMVNLSLINSSLNWVPFDTALGNNNWSLTAFVNSNATGTINLPVRASDNATNANVSEVIPVILDNTPPNASTITYPSNGQVLQAMSTWVNGTTDSDTINVTIYVDGTATNESVFVDAGVYNVSNVPIVGEGSHTINVSSYDVLGNVNATNASVTVLVDTVDPVISIVTPNALSIVYKQGGASLYVNFTYTETSPKNYTVVISNTTTTINTSTNASVSASPVSVEFTLNSTAAEGSYNVTVTMYDNSSRVNTSTAINAVVLDNTAPIFTSVLTHTEDAPSGYDNDSSINLTWTAASDVYSANITYKVYQDGVLNTSTANITSCNISGVSDGTHIFNVSATDGAGNVNATNISTTIEVDTTAPIAPTIEVPTSMQAFSTSPIWVNGTTTGASNVTIYVNGTATNVSEIVSSNMFNVSNVPLGAGDGTYVINVSAKDATGNINATQSSVTVILDTTDPVINMITPNATSPVYKQGGVSMYVNFTYTELNAKNYTVTISNSTVTINTSTNASVSASPVSVEFTLNSTAAEGYYNVTVTMYDNASRVNTSTAINAVVLDNTAPTAPSGLTPASGSFDNDGSITLSWTAASDDLSPTLNYSIYLNNAYNGSTTSTSYTITGVADGTRTFNVSAADAAGNVNATNDSTIITIDTVAPTIHNLTLSPNTTSTYDAPITVTVNVSDVGGSGINAVSAAGEPLDHQSGDLWNGTINAVYGTNTVTVIATDNASNSVTNTSLSYTGPTAPSSTDDGSSSSAGGRTLLPTSTTDDTEGTVVVSQEAKGIALSVPATTIAVDFTKEDIMSIEVEAKVEVSSVYITVQKLDSKPTSIPQSPSGSVHSYLNINVMDIDADNIAGANIAFKVEKKWLSQNNIGKDNVLLARFSEGVWQQLETTVLNGDDDFVHFSARTPGFSTFAIVAKDVAVTEPVDEIETPVSVEEPASEVVTETPTPVEEEGNGLPGFEAIFAVMGLLLVTLLVRRQEKN